jgi:50S ribosomal subunit-associated GTPase HflX
LSQEKLQEYIEANKTAVFISAKSNMGIESLKQTIEKILF